MAGPAQRAHEARAGRAQTIMTFTLVMVVYATAIIKPGHGNIAPLAIGFALFASAFVGVRNVTRAGHSTLLAPACFWCAFYPASHTRKTWHERQRRRAPRAHGDLTWCSGVRWRRWALHGRRAQPRAGPGPSDGAARALPKTPCKCSRAASAQHKP